MIKFFRKIRFDLLGKNKTGEPAWPVGRYFKYAIGEIVLVVIGILIALQINNWNEVRKTNNKEQVLLIALRQEFNQNQIALQKIIEVNQSNIEGARKLTSLLSPDVTTISDSLVANYFAEALMRDAIFRPSLGILNEAINSGNLSIIKNTELRSILSSFDAELQQLRMQEESVFDIRLDCFQSVINVGNFRKILENLGNVLSYYKLSPSPFQNSNKELLQSEILENKIVLFIGTSLYLEDGFLIPLKSRMSNCIDILNAEIND